MNIKHLITFSFPITLCGCITMGSVSQKRDELENEKEKWVQSCMNQANQVAEKYGLFIERKNRNYKRHQGATIANNLGISFKRDTEYINNLGVRSKQALASLGEHNCKPNVMWYWFGYPDCMDQAEVKINNLVENGCFLNEFVGELKETRKEIDKILAQNKAKDNNKKLSLERQAAFVIELEKSPATHVLLGLKYGQDGITCSGQVDGSFICERGAICEKSGYIRAIKDETNGIKPAPFDSYCEMDSSTTQSFFFVAKEKIQFSKFGYYGHIVIPVTRGPNSYLINNFGAKLPAASWVQVAPRFDPSSNLNLAH